MLFQRPMFDSLLEALQQAESSDESAMVQIEGSHKNAVKSARKSKKSIVKQTARKNKVVVKQDDGPENPIVVRKHSSLEKCYSQLIKFFQTQFQIIIDDEDDDTVVPSAASAGTRSSERLRNRPAVKIEERSGQLKPLTHENKDERSAEVVEAETNIQDQAQIDSTSIACISDKFSLKSQDVHSELESELHRSQEERPQPVQEDMSDITNAEYQSDQMSVIASYQNRNVAIEMSPVTTHSLDISNSDAIEEEHLREEAENYQQKLGEEDTPSQTDISSLNYQLGNIQLNAGSSGSMDDNNQNMSCVLSNTHGTSSTDIDSSVQAQSREDTSKDNDVESNEHSFAVRDISCEPPSPQEHSNLNEIEYEQQVNAGESHNDAISDTENDLKPIEHIRENYKTIQESVSGETSNYQDSSDVNENENVQLERFEDANVQTHEDQQSIHVSSSRDVDDESVELTQMNAGSCNKHENNEKDLLFVTNEIEDLQLDRVDESQLGTTADFESSKDIRADAKSCNRDENIEQNSSSDINKFNDEKSNENDDPDIYAEEPQQVDLRDRDIDVVTDEEIQMDSETCNSDANIELNMGVERENESHMNAISDTNTDIELSDPIEQNTDIAVINENLQEQISYEKLNVQEPRKENIDKVQLERVESLGHHQEKQQSLNNSRDIDEELDEKIQSNADACDRNENIEEIISHGTENSESDECDSEHLEAAKQTPIFEQEKQSLLLAGTDSNEQIQSTVETDRNTIGILNSTNDRIDEFQDNRIPSLLQDHTVDTHDNNATNVCIEDDSVSFHQKSVDFDTMNTDRTNEATGTDSASRGNEFENRTNDIDAEREICQKSVEQNEIIQSIDRNEMSIAGQCTELDSQHGLVHVAEKSNILEEDSDVRHDAFFPESNNTDENNKVSLDTSQYSPVSPDMPADSDTENENIVVNDENRFGEDNNKVSLDTSQYSPVSTDVPVDSDTEIDNIVDDSENRTGEDETKNEVFLDEPQYSPVSTDVPVDSDNEIDNMVEDSENRADEEDKHVSLDKSQYSPVSPEVPVDSDTEVDEMVDNTENRAGEDENKKEVSFDSPQYSPVSPDIPFDSDTDVNEIDDNSENRKDNDALDLVYGETSEIVPTAPSDSLLDQRETALKTIEPVHVDEIMDLSQLKINEVHSIESITAADAITGTSTAESTIIADLDADSTVEQPNEFAELHHDSTANETPITLATFKDHSAELDSDDQQLEEMHNNTAIITNDATSIVTTEASIAMEAVADECLNDTEAYESITEEHGTSERREEEEHSFSGEELVTKDIDAPEPQSSSEVSINIAALSIREIKQYRNKRRCASTSEKRMNDIAAYRLYVDELVDNYLINNETNDNDTIIQPLMEFYDDDSFSESLPDNNEISVDIPPPTPSSPAREPSPKLTFKLNIEESPSVYRNKHLRKIRLASNTNINQEQEMLTSKATIMSNSSSSSGSSNNINNSYQMLEKEQMSSSALDTISAVAGPSSLSSRNIFVHSNLGHSAYDHEKTLYNVKHYESNQFNEEYDTKNMIDDGATEIAATEVVTTEIPAVDDAASKEFIIDECNDMHDVTLPPPSVCPFNDISMDEYESSYTVIGTKDYHHHDMTAEGLDTYDSEVKNYDVATNEEIKLSGDTIDVDHQTAEMLNTSNLNPIESNQGELESIPISIGNTGEIEEVHQQLHTIDNTEHEADVSSDAPIDAQICSYDRKNESSGEHLAQEVPNEITTATEIYNNYVDDVSSDGIADSEAHISSEISTNEEIHDVAVADNVIVETIDDATYDPGRTSPVSDICYNSIESNNMSAGRDEVKYTPLIGEVKSIESIIINDDEHLPEEAEVHTTESNTIDETHVIGEVALTIQSGTVAEPGVTEEASLFAGAHTIKNNTIDEFYASEEVLSVTEVHTIDEAHLPEEVPLIEGNTIREAYAPDTEVQTTENNTIDETYAPEAISSVAEVQTIYAPEEVLSVAEVQIRDNNIIDEAYAPEKVSSVAEVQTVENNTIDETYAPEEDSSIAEVQNIENNIIAYAPEEVSSDREVNTTSSNTIYEDHVPEDASLVAEVHTINNDTTNEDTASGDSLAGEIPIPEQNATDKIPVLNETSLDAEMRVNILENSGTYEKIGNETPFSNEAALPIESSDVIESDIRVEHVVKVSKEASTAPKICDNTVEIDNSCETSAGAEINSIKDSNISAHATNKISPVAEVGIDATERERIREQTIDGTFDAAKRNTATEMLKIQAEPQPNPDKNVSTERSANFASSISPTGSFNSAILNSSTPTVPHRATRITPDRFRVGLNNRLIERVQTPTFRPTILDRQSYVSPASLNTSFVKPRLRQISNVSALTYKTDDDKIGRIYYKDTSSSTILERKTYGKTTRDTTWQKPVTQKPPPINVWQTQTTVRTGRVGRPPKYPRVTPQPQKPIITNRGRPRAMSTITPTPSWSGIKKPSWSFGLTYGAYGSRIFAPSGRQSSRVSPHLAELVRKLTKPCTVTCDPKAVSNYYRRKYQRTLSSDLDTSSDSSDSDDDSSETSDSDQSTSSKSSSSSTSPQVAASVAPETATTDINMQDRPSQIQETAPKELPTTITQQEPNIPAEEPEVIEQTVPTASTTGNNNDQDQEQDQDQDQEPILDQPDVTDVAAIEEIVNENILETNDISIANNVDPSCLMRDVTSDEDLLYTPFKKRAKLMSDEASQIPISFNQVINEDDSNCGNTSDRDHGTSGAYTSENDSESYQPSNHASDDPSNPMYYDNMRKSIRSRKRPAKLDL